MSTPTIEIRLIGLPRIIEPSGAVTTLSTGQAMILTLLVSAGRQGINLEDLKSAHDYATGVEQTSESIKMAVSRLRKRVGGSEVLTTGERYLLTLPDEQVDVWALKHFAVTADNRNRALELLAGEPFDGVVASAPTSFTTEVDRQRRRLAIELLDGGLHPTEIDTIVGFAMEADLDEQLAIAVGESLESIGGLPAAREFLRRYDVRIRHEFAGEPKTRFAKFQEKLAAACGDLATAASRLGLSEQVFLGNAEHEWFGRTSQANELAQQINDRVPTILLHGPSGVGKTRLAAELALRSREQGQHLILFSPDADPAASFEVFRLRLPGIADRLAELADVERSTMPLVYQAVIEQVRNETRDGPALVVVDNVHLLDSQSQALLRLLVRSTVKSLAQLLLVGVAEPEQSWVNLERAIIESGGVSAAVQPLDVEAIGSLVRSMHPGHTPAAYQRSAQEVWAASGGLPAMAATVARGLNPSTLVLDLRGESVPALVGLSEELRAVGRAAAVVGTSFNAADVSATSGIDVHEVTRQVQTMFDRGLIVADTGGNENRFVHALIREAFLRSCSPSMLIDLHARRSVLVDDPHERARHLVGAVSSTGDAIAPQTAGDALLQSGELLVADHQFREAIAIFTSWQELASNHDLAPPPPRNFHLPYGLALARSGFDAREIISSGVDAALAAGDAETAALVASAGLPGGEATVPASWRLDVLCRVPADELPRAAAVDHALHTARTASRLVDRQASATAIVAAAALAKSDSEHYRVTMARFLDGTLSPTDGSLLSDLRCVVEHGRPRLRAAAAQAEVLTLMRLGRPAQAQVLHFDELAADAGDTLRIWHALCLRATMLGLDGHHNRAEDARNEAIDFGVAMDIPIALEVGAGQVFWQKWLQSEHGVFGSSVPRDGGRSGLAVAAGIAAAHAAGEVDAAVAAAVKLVHSAVVSPDINTVESVAMVAPVISELHIRHNAFKATRAILLPYLGCQFVAGFGFWHLGPTSRAMSHLACSPQEAGALADQAIEEAQSAGFDVWVDRLDADWRGRMIDAAGARL